MEASVKHRSQGSVAVEFIVVFPIFIIVLFGIIQLSSLLYMRQELLNIVYNGVRYAAMNKNATNANVQTYVEQQLTNLGVSATTITLTPNNISQAERGTPLSLVLSVSANSLVLLPIPISFGQTQITISSSMAKEF